MNTLPIKGYTLTSIVYLEDFLSKEFNRRDIKHFFIDYTNDLAQVTEKIQCDYIQKLYENINKDYVKQVFQGLLKSFKFHPKFKNIDIEISDRGIREPSFVYIAIWS